MASNLLVALPLFLLVSSVSCHDITKILAETSFFSSFNSLLTQTQLASEINSLQNITVLVAPNPGMLSVPDQPAYALKRILSAHVLLDYYDIEKLNQLVNTTITVKTLFNTTGHTTGRNGFMNITGGAQDVITIGSAEPGSRTNARVMRLLASEPFNISVLQIDDLIIPPSIALRPSPEENAFVLPGLIVTPSADSPPARSMAAMLGFCIGAGVVAFWGALLMV